jgi:endonuclease G
LTAVLLFALAVIMQQMFLARPASAAASDVFFSEYIEGSSNNKAIEIYNGTGAPVNLGTGNYVLQLHSNGSASVSASLNLTNTIADGDVLVLAHGSANAAILAQADVISSTVINFNGDDAVVLRKGGASGAIVDVIGQIGFDPGTQWGADPTSTLDHTLRRKSTVCAGDTNGGDAFNPAGEWDGFANDTVGGLGAHTASCGGGGTTTNPTGAGSANPPSVVAGSNTTLTVNVTLGTNPSSSNISVIADLSSIGGSSTQALSNGGSGNTFTFVATVAGNTTQGSKSLPVTVSDSQSRSSNTAISLDVQSPPPPPDHVVISQIYGGGGNTSATYKNDYVELYNLSSTTFVLNGWSVQYAAAGGAFTQITPLAGTIAPGQYYLIKLASGGSPGIDLPEPNIEGGTNMSATVGKVALVNNGVALTGGSNPCDLNDPNLVDFVGYGPGANCREGGANAPAPAGPTVNSTVVLRNGNGGIDTNQNGNDFTVSAPNPRRTAPFLDSPPSVSSTDTDADAFASTPAPRDASIAVFFSEPVEVTGNWYDLTCASTGQHTAVVGAGPRNWVITPDVDFQPGEQCTFQIFAANVKDSDTNDLEPNTDYMQANYSVNFTVATGAAAPYTPSVHLTMGNPNGATADINQPNNYLLEKAEYAVSYNRDRGGPNWVSWHLSDDWTGTLTRVDTFRPDNKLPAAWNRVNQFDYQGSGFDRGHMTPSADRTETLPMNQATFLMDNIIPQAPDNNQQTWNNMEQALRAYTPANELYIVAGGAGIGGSGDNGPASTIAGGRITVPAFTWKVALVIPKGEDDISRVDCTTRAIAVIVPNTNSTNSDWTTYLKTVDQVEALTGYDFFSNLPEPIQRCVEAGINGNNPPLDTDADGVPDDTDNCPFTVNADQANFDHDSMGDVCDTDDDNDGVSDTDEAAAGSDPHNAASTPEVCDGVDNDLNDGVDEGFTDTDQDGTADCVDTDDDNDGVSDAAEIAAGSDPLNAASTPEVCDGVDNDLNDGVDEGFTDTDHDGQADCVDPDDDNDGVSDAAEIAAGSDPLNAASTPEVCDGVDNDLNDGIDEGFADTDHDGHADCVDPDDDNDGVSDSAEIAAGSDPLNAASTPEVCDGVDNDLNEGIDEGFTDTDHDGQADCVDADDDNDGQSDANEIACGSNPLDANSKALDTDGDNIPNCVDADDDNDGVSDASDNCPLTANADQTDTDHDGQGNVCDADDDNDGVLDGADNCPLVANANQADADHDGIGDVCDAQIGPPTNKDQCKNGGWQLFNYPHTFKNQGDCIQYVNNGH